MWPLSKVCDALDFFIPGVVEHIRSVGEEPMFHSKQWEYAQLLEARRRLAPEARTLVGLGVGREKTLPLLAAGAEEVVATDLYDMPGAWDVASQRPDRVFPELRNLRTHSMDMRRIDLPPESADFVWAMCSIEHVGTPDDIVDTVRQAGALLRPGGVLYLTSEYTFDPGPYVTRGTVFLDAGTLRRFFTDTGLHLVEPLDLRISDHPFNMPLWWRICERFAGVPHVIYRYKPRLFGGTYGTCVSLALCREDRGADRVLEDADTRRNLERCIAIGRRINRRLLPPIHWG